MQNKIYWTYCKECDGIGKKKQRIRKNARLKYQKVLSDFEKTNGQGLAPIRPEASLQVCSHCSGTGLLSSEKQTVPNTDDYPHVAIIGGGIGGTALAVACMHRGIPFTIFERDTDFNSRSQGYGLTLQQASKSMEGFGICKLKEGVVSNRHVVHTPSGKVVAEWGMRKWLNKNTNTTAKRTNIHISRQSLRLELLEQLKSNDVIKWGHKLINLYKTDTNQVELNFEVNGVVKTINTDLVVGADGIRSTVRNLIISEEKTPLRYLECMVILGICPLNLLENPEHSLLDSETVFQTANGTDRIYMMPFDSHSIMWQLSFPIEENHANNLSAKGAKVLKEEACKRLKWHTPIPEILERTPLDKISGYPVYDRELLNSELLHNAESVTLIGDAAHPMSPFKGQGANQALLDALALARAITKTCKSSPQWKKDGLRKSILNKFELEMISRSSVKVTDSAAAARFLHSEIVLSETNQPRGNIVKSVDS